LNCFIKTTADYKHVVLRISCSLGDFFNKWNQLWVVNTYI